jgi:hypothetical protein
MPAPEMLTAAEQDPKEGRWQQRYRNLLDHKPPQ